jgi:Protein of unknown function (DUF1153)
MSTITRWTAQRKAEVVQAVWGKKISLRWALQKYQITKEEFADWSDKYARYGTLGLRSTYVQRYRTRRTCSETRVGARGTREARGGRYPGS